MICVPLAARARVAFQRDGLRIRTCPCTVSYSPSASETLDPPPATKKPRHLGSRYMPTGFPGSSTDHASLRDMLCVLPAGNATVVSVN